MKDKIKLYLDDCRECPEGWTIAKNYNEAVQLMNNCEVEHMSLDHDLGTDELCDKCQFDSKCESDPDECLCRCHFPGKTGLDFVKWMIENNKWSLHIPRVHSANYHGKLQMEGLITDHGPYDETGRLIADSIN